MSGEQLPAWFAGPAEVKDAFGNVKKTPDPRETLKGLWPVSAQARIDFNRGLIFGRLEKEGFLFKYGKAWGNWPLLELAELETLALAKFVQQDLQRTERGKETKNKRMGIEVSETTKQEGFARSRGMYQALSKQAG